MMTLVRSGCLALSLVFSVGVGAGMAGTASTRIAIRARAFDGMAWSDSLLVIIAGDHIESVAPGSAPIPDNVTLVEVPGATLSPGFIDCDSSLGIARRRDEPEESSSVDLLLADAFAPDAGESESLRRSGVTLAWLAAGPTSIIGARGALIQSSPSGPPRILAASHGLCASLSDAASQPDRAPTSVPQQADLIARVAAEHSGEAPLRVRFDDAGSARVAARLTATTGLAVGLSSTDEALVEVLSAPGAAGRARLCLSGLGPSSSMEQLRLAAAAASSSRVVLGSGSSIAGPRALRWAAAALVAQGVPAERVLTALTREAAQASRAGHRGVIERGAIADLVLWSGDPVSPASRVLRAWVSGEEVHAEP